MADKDRRPLRYPLKKSHDNQWYYLTVAPNGETLGRSETYTRKENARRAIRKLGGEPEEEG
jgi:uncharacterized protein YegP (UPF0339 family)